MTLDSTILHRALELSPSQRAELAHRLLLSLQPRQLDPDTDQAWALEIEERALRADTTKMPLSDWRSAIDRVRNSLKHPPASIRPEEP